MSTIHTYTLHVFKPIGLNILQHKILECEQSPQQGTAKQCHTYGYPSDTDLYVEGESDVRVFTARHTHFRASESIEMRGKIGVKYDVVLL